ncbi:MAG: molybdate ABC transporter substrate-binding protein [Coriobacteriaceae bacterium]|nr:molybdate ABC transporter substrate-binding protein [Coriobacteriaceae bacterium]
MKKTYKRFLVPALCMAIVAAFALAGCGGSSSTSSSAAESSAASADAVELNIFAANSLQKALPEVQALYTQQNPNVTFGDTQFEASGTLVQKLKDGASADIFIAASKKTMDNAVENGNIDEATRTDMFTNDLVICVQEGNDKVAVTDIKELATNDDIKTIAIGEPNAVPAGKYALQALESAGLVTYDEAEDGTVENIKWDASIEGKINAGADKVGTVASYVKEGQADVGFVYTSDIFRYDGIEVAYTTPADSHKTILYPGGVTTDSANAEVAKDFLTFCLENADAQKIFSEYGFELV